MAKTGQGLVDYAKSKIGTPYFYGCKMQPLTYDIMATMHKSYPNIVSDAYMTKAKVKGQVGKINTDCSGLIYGYTKKNLGSAQLYQQAYTRLKPSDYKKWANGVVCWRSGHVGIFNGQNGKYTVIEAKGINFGTIESKFDPKQWSAGLTFKNISYDYSEKCTGTWKSKNPYAEPTDNIKINSRGKGVKWVQYELVQAGYNLKIDGICGKNTVSAIKAYQKSCKIKVDGICGKNTRSKLKEDGL